MKTFKTLDELNEYNSSVFTDISYKPTENLFEEGSWEHLQFNARPHEVFNLDWSNYGSLDFADRFLPYIKKYYKGKGSYFFDGAELFPKLKKENRNMFAYADSKKLTSIISYTYPKNVFAKERKNRVRPAKHEICMFVEVDKAGNTEISFKFGANFKERLKGFSLESNDEQAKNNLV